jgi:hypothetical protein
MLLVLATKRGVPVSEDTSLEEIEEGLQELDESQAIGRLGRSGRYWIVIKETLIDKSSTEDVDEAVREWVSDGDPFRSDSYCELCGKIPIRYNFPIRNKVNANRLVVGSECIHNYLKIAGYETPQALRSKLEAQRALLKKQERGEAGEGEYAALNETFTVETELRAALGRSVGGEQDLDWLEYKQALEDAVTVCNQIGATGAVVQAAQKALISLGPLRKVMEENRKGHRFEGYGVGTLVTTIMRKKDPGEKLQALKRVQDVLETVLKFGAPSEVIARAWGAVRDCRDKLIQEVTRKCDRGKAQVSEDYRDELELTKPYAFLHSVIEAGVEVQRQAFDEQLLRIKVAVNSEDFIEEMQRESSETAGLLSLSFTPDMANVEGPTGKIAVKICEFVNAVARGRLPSVIGAIEGIYRLDGPVVDLAGVKASLLKAANDGLVEADILGDDAIDEFAQEVEKKDPRVLDIVQKEVDEVALLAKMTGNQKVFEVMGQQLGFDVERAFSSYTTDPTPKLDEERFCRDIFERWVSGRLAQLSPAQMSNIQRQMQSKGGREVKHSVWAALKSELTKKYSPIR